MSSKDAHLSFSKFCADGSVLFITNSISSSRRLISHVSYVWTPYVYKGITGVFHLRFFQPNLYLYMGTLVKRGHLIKELMGSFIFSFSSHMATKLSDLSSPSFSSSHPFLIWYNTYHTTVIEFFSPDLRNSLCYDVSLSLHTATPAFWVFTRCWSLVGLVPAQMYLLDNFLHNFKGYSTIQVLLFDVFNLNSLSPN